MLQALAAQTVQTKQYDDGGVYEGEFLNGKQNGTGTYRLPNGYEYTGDWVDGEIRGKGTARFPNGRFMRVILSRANRPEQARSFRGWWHL